MKTSHTKLVLARWADVEPNDVVWEDQHLYRVLSEAFDTAQSSTCGHYGPECNVWSVEQVGGDYYTRNELAHRPTDQVPVVVEE